MSKHTHTPTPTPWKDRIILVACRPGDLMLHRVFSEEDVAPDQWFEAKSNASLITAAPELLDALVNLRQFCVAMGHGDCPDATAVIRKAVGLPPLDVTIKAIDAISPTLNKMIEDAANDFLKSFRDAFQNKATLANGNELALGCWADQRNTKGCAEVLEDMADLVGVSIRWSALDVDRNDWCGYCDELIDAINEGLPEGYVVGYHPEESGTIMLMRSAWWDVEGVGYMALFDSSNNELTSGKERNMV